ncbi:hypothetical protein GGR21_004232 [Dysgonomonas hofstadii]|uniref:DUF3408 domain-containing protein n=1 Tax=Dysgonomonas hofstadii TaxID=637886 RepID=A0A840CQL4_9BACT|nr:DUF3408 domain-containing protein [Dysgonomonas hofstadii]MBB4038300.1 hypothetical protein [Dysgonomonas hofstadii]
MSKKIDTSGLDSDFIIGQTDRTNREAKPTLVEKSTVADAVPTQVEPMAPVAVPTPLAMETTREESKRRKPKVEPLDYKSLFIQEAAIAARSGKTVYICKEHHDRIIKILHVIAKNEVSLFSYIYNVLEHHFNAYQEEITELYDKNLEKPF